MAIIEFKYFSENLYVLVNDVRKRVSSKGRTFFKGGRGVGKFENKNSSFCTAFVEELKIVQSGTKQRNLLQASEVKFIQSLFVTKKNPAETLLNPPYPPTPPPTLKLQVYNGPSLKKSVCR